MPAPGTAITRQRYKVVVLGAPSAGKTALVRRLADGSFMDGPRPRGLDFYTCHITLRDDVSVALQLWDLSDCPCRPEDDHAPLAAYVFNSQAVLFVYDVSCPSSLEVLRYALRAVEAATAADGGARPYFALIANKADLRWTASEGLARELAARHGCVRYALSARSGQGVSRAAVQLACDLAGVPLAAVTEHSAHFLEPDGSPLGPPLQAEAADPDAASAHAPEQASRSGPGACATGQSLGFAAAGAAGASGGTTALQQWQAASEKFYARAPAYQTSARTQPQGSSPGSLDELSLYGLGGGGGGGGLSGGIGEPPWQPVSRSTTPSRAATLISKTGPLGQRIRTGSPPPPPLSKAGRSGSAKGEAAAVAAAHASPREGASARGGAGAVSERGGSLSPSGSFQRQSEGWRGLLCCLPARRQ